jgi:hypothetical protein
MRALAFYLPQFHPIPENDAWWGTGFTEWNKVVRARPQFAGHDQPRLPTDLGFYDLRVPETRQAQAVLAQTAGLDGFCYYHYWFEGRRLLERPLDEVLSSGAPDFPFCLCWANEDWTRTWDGGLTGEVLMRQGYSAEDDLAHIRWLAEVFADRRYVRIDGRPLFIVYRASQLPDPRRTADTWREEAARLGIGDLFLARVESFWNERDDPRSIGFDAAVEFQPDGENLPDPLRAGRGWRMLRRLGLAERAYGERLIMSYADLAATALARPPADYVRFPCVTPGWDNSPRRPDGGGWVFTGSTPDLFEAWLREVVARAKARETELLFLNAWNEWAEGNYLEPGSGTGRRYLDAVANVLASG